MTRTHYINELEELRGNLIEMGETALAELGAALSTLTDGPAGADRAKELEAKIDEQNRAIREQCLSLITQQAPVARDARLIIGVLDSIVDLESIGDNALEIANLGAALQKRPTSQILMQAVGLGGKTTDTLSAAIDSWRQQDSVLGMSVRAKETAFRSECQGSFEKLSALLVAPGDGSLYVNLLLILRHLDRIVRHAVSVAEQAAAAAPAAQG